MATTEDVLLQFIGNLAAVSDLDTLRERWCEASRRSLDADGVVITSETVIDGRTTLGWTQLLSKRLESLQDGAGEGPLIDSLASGKVVLGSFGDAADDDLRWPTLRRQVDDLGFSGTLIAIPLRSELSLRGVLLGHRAGGERSTDAARSRFLGNAIGTAVLQDPCIGAQGHVMAEVLTDRDVVHEATGVLQVGAGIRYEDSLALLRALAFTRGEHLGSVAKAVVVGELNLVPDTGPVRRPAPGRD
jgi:hypothetical protein